MFKLLSKESNIFSIPVYLGFLLGIIILFNIFNLSTIGVISAVITFAGVALGYFLFDGVDLTYKTHLPLFLYTILIFGLYPGDLDLGISFSLLTNSFIILILTNRDATAKNSTYLLVGSLLALNFIFLPTSYPLIPFVLLHIISTSERVALNTFRLFFGMFLIGITYFSVAYFLGWNSWNLDYLPLVEPTILKEYHPLLFLSPIVLMVIYAVLDHFNNFNKKSPTSRFKYSLLLVFTLSQLLTIIFYMGKNFEYLLLLAFPISIILSRMLKFLPKYWMQEVGVWIILITILLFKVADYYALNI